MEMEYDKDYLIKSVLGDALANYGVDTEKLLAKKEDVGDKNKELIATSLDRKQRAEISSKFKKEMLCEDARVMTLSGIFKPEAAKEIMSAFAEGKYADVKIVETVNPATLKQVYSSFSIKRDTPIDLENFVTYEDIKPDEMESLFSGSKIKNSEGIKFKFPIHCPKSIEITAGDLDMSGTGCINNLFIDDNDEQYVTSKVDLCKYLCNYMNGSFDNYVSNVYIKK